jgi:hypothetical protein
VKSLKWRILVLVLLVLGAGAPFGCQKLAWVLVQIVKPWTDEETTQAQYDLKNKSVLVLVDTKDSALASDMPWLESAMSEAIGKVLSENQACGPVVSGRSIEMARKAEPRFSEWSVVQVGKYFNVDRVLHVELSMFRLRDDAQSNVYHGYAEAAVRIVDSETGQQVWPVLSAARLMQAETQPGVEAETRSEQESILVDGFADKIARQFFSYKTEDLSIRPKVK